MVNSTYISSGRSAVRDLLTRFGPVIHSGAYHVYSVWLFTRSDLKTILLPSTFFAVVNYLALTHYDLPIPHGDAFAPITVSRKSALAMLWTWAHLLPMVINNQRSPSSVREDTINKPWRPIACGRVSPQAASVLFRCLYPMAGLVSLVLGGGRQTVALFFFDVWYNQWNGANANPFIRNLLNAFGYICFTSGALEAAYGSRLPLTNPLLDAWLVVMGGIVLTTVHVQDMFDQEGDSQSGRRTLPLVIGDAPARIALAILMPLWGFLCPWVWHAGWAATVVCAGLSTTVAMRTYIYRSVQGDKRTYQIWNAWICSVFAMPLFAGA